MNFIENVVNHAKAGYPGIIVNTSEWTRLEGDVKKAADRCERQFLRWTVTNGWTDDFYKKGTPLPPGPKLFETIITSTEKTIFLMHVFPEFFRDPGMRQAIRETLIHCKSKRKTIVMVSPSIELPEDLEKEFSIIDFNYPTRNELESIIQALCKKVNEKKEKIVEPTGDELHKIADAALGLTVQEGENAFALSIAMHKRLDIDTILQEKRQIVKKSGFLECYDTTDGIDSVGGLYYLKQWLEERSKGFTDEALKFGLLPPKGVLLVGVPGTGKSLVAKVIAKWWQIPLLKLDMGKIFGSLVGASESNIRQALKMAEAVAPCVLFIDELEKGAAGLNGSDSSDGGTTQRVLGTFLSWMQDRTAPVFVVATANNINALPPEMLRKGRWDELFGIDLPTPEERVEIID